MKSIFHLAYHVTDLNVARYFYGEILGCHEGRSTENWVEFDFFGHRISLHLGMPFKTTRTDIVNGQKVPMPHLGVILEHGNWEKLAKRLERANVDFIVPPQVRSEGEPGEQWTMFFTDTCGNPIEVKGLKNLDDVFAH